MRPHDDDEARREKSLQKRAVELIKPLISPDAEDRVRQTVRQFNNAVREAIRTETGLRLADDQTNGAVPIRIVVGFSGGVARLIDRHPNRALWRLVMLQPKLGGVIDGLGALLSAWDELAAQLPLPRDIAESQPAIERTHEVVGALQALAVAKRALDEVRDIEEDILGAYFHGGFGSHIEIYWLANALFAAAFGVRVEDLTVVCLAHELAHAYTHVGRDIDGHRWRDPGFGQSGTFVKEGLAQFYTAAVARKLMHRAPGMYDAYATLLKHQPPPYTAHTRWLGEDEKRRREIVRYAMLRSRSEGEAKVTDTGWMRLLAETAGTLKV